MNFSQITDSLFIGTTPLPRDYDILRELGITLVLNMRIERRPYRDPGRPPLNVLWLPTPDCWPLPVPFYMLRRGVTAALETLGRGEKVYTHCAQGVHRGVAMGAAILIALGHPPETAMQMIKSRRAVADPHARHIRGSILRFARKWPAID